MEDLQAILPDGSEFDFWEQKTQWKREWIVDAKASEDGADGTAAHPFPRIQQAASLAEPGFMPACIGNGSIRSAAGRTPGI